MASGNMNSGRSNNGGTNGSEERILCTGCRKWLPADYKFCPYCGQPVKKYAEPEDDDDERGRMMSAVYAPPGFF